MILHHIDVTDLHKLRKQLEGLGEDLNDMTREGLFRVMLRAQTLMLQPTIGWKHRIYPEIKVVGYGKNMYGVLTIEDDIYFWLNFGTEPHEIRAVNAPSLVFPRFYDAITSVGSLEASTRRSYGPYIYAQTVFHGGIVGRHFDVTTLEELEPSILKIIKQEIDRAIIENIRG